MDIETVNGADTALEKRRGILRHVAGRSADDDRINLMYEGIMYDVRFIDDLVDFVVVEDAGELHVGSGQNGLFSGTADIAVTQDGYFHDHCIIVSKISA